MVKCTRVMCCAATSSYIPSTLATSLFVGPSDMESYSAAGKQIDRDRFNDPIVYSWQFVPRGLPLVSKGNAAFGLDCSQSSHYPVQNV